MRAVVLAGVGWLTLLWGCLSAELPPRDAAPRTCAEGGSACPALAGFATSCEGGVCVARAPTGDALADCAGEGRYAADLRFDARNCGACGAVCPGSAVCVDGACACASGEARCGGSCVSTSTSRDHCGGCGRACGARERCAAGACVACEAGEAPCGDRCARLASDPAHCGGCGRACGGAETCVDGACMVMCAAGQTLCGGACVDTASDGAHCGRCGAACGPGSVCFEARCYPAGPSGCPGGFLRCDERCVDPTGDPNHCGACGARCPAGAICQGGACACLVGLFCGGRCTDAASDPANCGRCGVACAPGVCRDGACVCPADRARCDGRCVDLRTDRGNCGRCGDPCSSGTCRAGRCFRCDAASICDEACVDLSTARDHCGACGTRCGDGEQCTGGRCVACPAGWRLCAGACVDVRAAAAHCGACGRACDVTQTCDGGRCVGSCLPSTPFVHADVNCGACGVACDGASICIDGRCTAAAPRLKAPISATFVSSARPWFRWELPAGADGARVEVCATRACDRVEASWEAAGDRLRAPAALATGVHHWRAYARRGGRFDVAPSLVWEFAVPGGPVAPAPGITGVPVLHDLNGDGAEDRVEGSDDCGMGVRCTLVRYGRPADGVAPPDQRIVAPPSDPGPDGFRHGLFPGGAFLPDLNGDGFGELFTEYSAQWRRATGWEYQESARMHAGSSTGVFLAGEYLGLSDHDLWSGGGPVLACVGDRDGDGYGDFAQWSRVVSALDYTERLGGRGRSRAGSYGSSPDTPAGIAVGDFNADGRSDLVYWLQDGRGWLTPGAASPPRLPAGREIVECPPRPYDPSQRFSATVGDVNDDGYDDLTFSVEGSRTPLVATRMLGGPEGLSPTRCAPLP